MQQNIETTIIGDIGRMERAMEPIMGYIGIVEKNMGTIIIGYIGQKAVSL